VVYTKLVVNLGRVDLGHMQVGDNIHDFSLYFSLREMTDESSDISRLVA